MWVFGILIPASAAVYDQNFTYPDNTSNLRDGSILTSTNASKYIPIVMGGKLKLSDISKNLVYSY